MEVYPQILSAYFDTDGKMFDVLANFFIIDPRNSAVEQAYMFSKIKAINLKSTTDIDNLSPNKRNNRLSSYVGSDTIDSNDSKPFKFSGLTSGKGEVRAELALFSQNSDSFKVIVSIPHKNGYVVKMTFMGEKPDWLLDSGEAIVGFLLKGNLKDFSAKN